MSNPKQAMPKIPPAVYAKMMQAAKEVIAEAGADYDSEIQDHSETIVKALSIGDTDAAYATAYHIKGTASAYGWPVIGAVAGFLLDRLDATKDTEKRIKIGLRLIKPMILFASPAYKAKDNMVAPILAELKADLKKHKL